MRVCFYHPSFYPGYGGQVIYLRERLIPALEKRGVECVALSLENESGVDHYRGIHISRIKRYSLFNFKKMGYILLWYGIYRYFKRESNKFDLIYFADGGGGATFAISALVDAGIPAVSEVTLMGADDANTFRNRKFGAFVINQLKKLDTVITVSNDLRNSYLENDFNADHVRYIPYGVELEKYHYPDLNEKLCIREKLGIPASKKVITFIGGINKRKNVITLVKALNLLKDKHKDILLFLIGPENKRGYEEYGEKLRAYIRDKELEQNVVFTGLIDNVHEYLLASDIYASASHAEGLPISVIEAMASGNACVLSDIPGMRDLVSSNEIGLLISPDDENSFAEAFRYLIENDRACENYALRAREKVEKEFSVEVRADRVFELLTNLASTKKGP